MWEGQKGAREKQEWESPGMSSFSSSSGDKKEMLKPEFFFHALMNPNYGAKAAASGGSFPALHPTLDARNSF